MNEPTTSLNLGRFPRVPLCHQPTPIESMPRLSKALGGPNLFVKRDDCTGLATGGNKTRKLEFLVGEAMAQGADTLVTMGAVQSNHVRQTAAAACRVAMQCHALVERAVLGVGTNYEDTGNVVIDRLLGATLKFLDAGVDINVVADETMAELKRQSYQPYMIPVGGSNVVGALGYASCAEEIVGQSQSMKQNFDWIVVATGSTGTHAGLLSGLVALQESTRVMGISVSRPTDQQVPMVHELATATCKKIDCVAPGLESVMVNDCYVGKGYGHPAESTVEALQLAARYEGLLLDPVYSGKAFAGMIGLIRQDYFKPSENILFLHTGGAAVLSTYMNEVIASQ